MSNTHAYNQGKDSAIQCVKFESEDDMNKAATFYQRKYGYSNDPDKAADFIEGFKKEGTKLISVKELNYTKNV